MNKILNELRYTNSHEWVRQEKDGTLTIGITDYAQSNLGDFVFIALPSVSSDVNVGEECCTVESVKAASDVYSPISGEVTETNDALESSPDIVNSDPYGNGWLFRIRPDEASDFEKLMTADEYKAKLSTETH